jgi:hypothetical protein
MPVSLMAWAIWSHRKDEEHMADVVAMCSLRLPGIASDQNFLVAWSRIEAEVACICAIENFQPAE